eukprot:m.95309 g.95309  ORF g.95309 m.95309 type:complete len:725 (+) comp36844_c0_seq1:28-2202(+)
MLGFFQLILKKLKRRRLPSKSSTFIVAICVLLVTLAVFSVFSLYSVESDNDKAVKATKKEHLRSDSLVLDIHPNENRKNARNTTCRFHSCFDVLRCGLSDSPLISVHITPPSGLIVDPEGRPLFSPPSRQFIELLRAIEASPYYEADPKEACLIVPAVDLLNANRIDIDRVGSVLASLPLWNGGENHILFNMVPPMSTFGFGSAILAGAGFRPKSYRVGYDVSMPVFNALTWLDDPVLTGIVDGKSVVERSVLIAVLSQSAISFHDDRNATVQAMKEASQKNVEIVQRCTQPDVMNNPRKLCVEGNIRSYPEYLGVASYCLVWHPGTVELLDAMMTGCIPVLVNGSFNLLPFSEVLDWSKTSVTVLEADLPQLVSILEHIPPNVTKAMSIQAHFLWKTYMSSMEKIALTTLKILNDRVFSHKAWQSHDWNSAPEMQTHPNIDRVTRPPPLFIPLKPPQSDGFTAVILTYNRVEMLFKVVTSVSQAHSLSKIVVVWNNQDMPPPPSSLWPKIEKPLVVIKTPANKLGNRFFPHTVIETEAILNIDDDLFMLTADELEFGYQVWREFPERLVGFPGRVHLWDEQLGSWKYEPEWVNQVSMVLSGAAFHHKFYSHAYSYLMPSSVRDWVDEHMNCEDIAINFLVSSYSRQPPIKVTPRKRFKCANCTAKESLWSDPSHFHERNVCFNHFVKIFGHMPLKAVEFRADPVLFKDNFPDQLKRFPGIRDV